MVYMAEKFFVESQKAVEIGFKFIHAGYLLSVFTSLLYGTAFQNACQIVRKYSQILRAAVIGVLQ